MNGEHRIGFLKVIRRHWEPYFDMELFLESPHFSRKVSHCSQVAFSNCLGADPHGDRRGQAVGRPSETLGIIVVMKLITILHEPS